MTIVFVFFAHILGMPSDISKFLPYVVYMRDNVFIYVTIYVCVGRYSFVRMFWNAISECFVNGA